MVVVGRGFAESMAHIHSTTERRPLVQANCGNYLRDNVEIQSLWSKSEGFNKGESSS